MNQDELIEMGDTPEPVKYTIDESDYDLLIAVKTLIGYSDIRVPNGDNNRLELVYNGGYNTAASAEKLIRYAEYRTNELVKYREKLSVDINQTQALVDLLPKTPE